MKPVLRNLAASRMAVPSAEDQDLLRALRQIAFSPTTKVADRLRAIELLGKQSGLFREQGDAGAAPSAEDARERLQEMIMRRLEALRVPEGQPQ